MSAQQIAVSRLPHTADALIGRDAELARLDAAWGDPAQHVLVIRGIGGEGKTSLVAAWADRLAARDYDGASYFDWSFYSQGTRDQPGASAGPFVAAALTFFGGEEGAALANSPASGRDKAARLLEYLRAHRTLLILDGLEPLQYPPGPHAGRFRDDDMAVLLKGLAQKNPGLCVVTTREPVTDLARFQHATAPELELERLSEEAGSAVLRRLFEPATPKRVHHVQSTPAEREEIVRAVKGHALTLRLLGGYVYRCLRDVRRWREVDYAHADAEFVTNPNSPETRYGHAFKTIAAYERWLAGGGVRGVRQLAVLRLLGLFDRPAVATSLAALRAEPVIPGLTDSLVGLSAAEWNATLSDLEECGLVSVPRASAAGPGEPPLDAHPLLREYFARRLQEERPKAWRAGHRRLFEHLCATTAEGEEPTLDALQPLYQAVAHGCRAELHQQTLDAVYYDRIRRGGESYSTSKLGAFASDLGAVACFFEAPWSRVWPSLTENAQAWMLASAAFCLRALGRLAEALEPMRAAVQREVRQEKWKNAAIGAGNLSELKLALGEVPGAVAEAEQAVTLADQSGASFQRIAKRTTLAAALYQWGHRDQARALFRQAEDMQAQYPLLYSLPGFRYCDLLLADAERAAWGTTAGAKVEGDVRAACRDVAGRANQTFKIAERDNWLLDIALDHLTLGRSELFEAILGGSDFGAARAKLDEAVSGLRRAGTTHHLPRGLLARAWLRAVDDPRTGPESATTDLDEAWEIAERGPMPLFLADILLYRARLFAHESPYPWAEADDGPPRGPKDDLADAQRLIEKHGYGRRADEFADALADSRHWPDARKPLALPAHTATPPDRKEHAMHTVTRTVVQVDLVGYSTIAGLLDQGLGVETSARLDQQIQEFVDAGLAAVGVARRDAVKRPTGDGAQLVFDTPSQAHDFAVALHNAARSHNAGKPAGIGKRVFRVGVATGELVLDPQGGIAESSGMVIVRAARLEASAGPGGVLCDPATLAGLAPEVQARYGRRETVLGKRGETFDAHRCVLDPDGRKDAEHFTGPAAVPRPEAGPARPAAPPGKVDRKELLKLLDKVKSHQFDDLVFLLGVPVKLFPPDVLDLARRKSALLKWADEESELGNLLELLREMVGSADAIGATRTDTPPASPGPSAPGALAMWQKKLAYLQVAEAKESDTTAKFKLQEEIAEAKAKIGELGGST
ncbi:MAG: NACHT domain-containing protein [Planctomycetes bacterium]|nr:NACHT domain-containing protein [Planctomycetota bacterium]